MSNGQSGRSRRSRVRELRDLGFSDTFIEETISLQECGIEFTEPSPEMTQRIVEASMAGMRAAALQRKHNQELARKFFWRSVRSKILDWFCSNTLNIFMIIIITLTILSFWFQLRCFGQI